MTESGSGTAPTASEISADFTEIALTLFRGEGTDETVARILGLAVETIDGCDFAGLVVLKGQSILALGLTGAAAEEIEAIQDRTGEGPCFTATRDGVMSYAEVLAKDDRWPRFGPPAVALGVESILAVPFASGDQSGALNLYARLPRSFSIIDRARGQMLASLAGLALSTAQSHEREDVRAANLTAALATREVIGQAQGILMEREGISADQAFDVLRKASQRLNIKVRTIAQDLVETRENQASHKREGGPSRT